ncbi:ankyrin repeat domain-containing protein 50-like [Centruroides sculpturatus]|uniref:ankyrin repeat domain-containing protein 50-like n=1 Tax=Centruroides sculpturatus TaxID=218467 RepID=UPI000C6D0696|nr:ankyrin repeat domain-containing protein 50-like [Centruroides sculpturatus]
MYNSVNNPLYAAVGDNNVEEVCRLLDRGEDPNVISWENNGRPLIIEAVIGGDAGIVKVLIDAGVDINARNVQGETALHLVCQARYFNVDIIHLLLDSGQADLNVQENLSGNTPLHIFIKTFSSNGCNDVTVSIFKRMVDGTNINIHNHRGETLLHRMVTSIRDCGELMELFLNRGVDLNVVNERGETPLVCAIDKGYDSTAIFLIKCGTDTKICDRYGQTALHHAAQRNRSEVVAHLLEVGCPVNGQDVNGDTALYLAASKGNTEVVKLLLAHPSVDEKMLNVPTIFSFDECTSL